MSFVSDVTEKDLQRERLIARKLRNSGWWKRKCAAGTCYYCGLRVPSRELTMDHLVPLVRGGRSTKGNIVAACKGCNNKKKYLLPFEWEDYLTCHTKAE